MLLIKNKQCRMLEKYSSIKKFNFISTKLIRFRNYIKLSNKYAYSFHTFIYSYHCKFELYLLLYHQHLIYLL